MCLALSRGAGAGVRPTEASGVDAVMGGEAGTEATHHTAGEISSPFVQLTCEMQWLLPVDSDMTPQMCCCGDKMSKLTRNYEFEQSQERLLKVSRLCRYRGRGRRGGYY